MPAVLEPPETTGVDDADRDPVEHDGGRNLPPDRGGGGGGGGDDGGDDGRDGEGFFARHRPWVTLATFWHPAEAHIARIRLESAGVVCVLLDEFTAATNVFAIAVGGVKLQVPRAQVGRAAALLRAARLDHHLAADLDVDEVFDPDELVAVARFGRLLDAKAAACIVEAARLDAEAAAIDPDAPYLGLILPAKWAARLWPSAELRVARRDVADAARALRATPYAAGLTPWVRRPRCDVCQATASHWRLDWRSLWRRRPGSPPRLRRRCRACGNDFDAI